MTYREMNHEELRGLVGQRESVTGMEYPAQGLQPYYQWLVNSLHKLALASAGALRVDRSDEALTKVYVAPGRVTMDEVVLVYEGGTMDLATYNNATAHVWLANVGGSASVVAGESAQGWPVEKHIKLAEVTLAGGRVTEVMDRRFEALFRV